MNTPKPTKVANAAEEKFTIAVLAEAREVLREAFGVASRESIHACMIQALAAQYRSRGFPENLRPHAARVFLTLGEFVEASEDGVAAASDKVNDAMRAYIAQLQANDVGASGAVNTN